MANNTLHTCTCPRCNSAGRSVAAMNYAETQRWDKRGTFSGSGVGIGTGGIGIGFGGGTYSEHGEQQTKRADVFEEPARFAKPVLGVVVFGMIVMAAYSSAPGILGDMATSSGADPMSELSSSLMPVLAVVAPVVALLIGGMAVMTALRNQKEEDRLNKEVWPKQVHRYNQLRYCEHCHILELTRFRGHIILCVQGVADVQSPTAVPGGISPADGRAGSSRPLTRAALA